MERCDERKHHPQMAAVVEEGEKPPVETRKRADTKNERQEQKPAGAVGAHVDDDRVDRVGPRMRDVAEERKKDQVQSNGRDYEEVVNDLGPRPLNGDVLDAHRASNAGGVSWDGGA